MTSERIMDIRLVVVKNSKAEDIDVVKLFNEIKEYLHIYSETEVLKACIRIAHENLSKIYKK